MKAIILFALFSTSAFAVEFVTKIQSVLPFGYYQGEYCSVSIGNGFAAQGVSLSINNLVNGNLVSTTMSLYENSPWTEILKDNSDFDSIDIKAKDNRDVVQRLIIQGNQVSIILYRRSRMEFETTCEILR